MVKGGLAWFSIRFPLKMHGYAWLGVGFSMWLRHSLAKWLSLWLSIWIMVKANGFLCVSLFNAMVKGGLAWFSIRFPLKKHGFAWLGVGFSMWLRHSLAKWLSLWLSIWIMVKANGFLCVSLFNAMVKGGLAWFSIRFSLKMHGYAWLGVWFSIWFIHS